MSEDESQTKEAPQINAVITCIQKEETLSHEFQKKVLARAKAKKEPEAKEKQSEAERLFFLFFPEASHWEAPSMLLPFNPTTYLPYFKQEALAILATGIITEQGLKGHAGHKKIFPFNQRDLRDLIVALLDIDYQYQEVYLSPRDILKHFDNRFESAAAFARLSGVRGKRIKEVHEEWREKISLAVSRGNFPSNWRELSKGNLVRSYKYLPKTEAQALANVFLQYASQAPPSIIVEWVPTGRIVEWVNAILKSLGRPTVGKTNLNKFISKRRERLSITKR